MTQYNFVIIRTDRGGRYARKILRSIKWLNENKYSQYEFRIFDMTISEFIENIYQVHANSYLKVPNSPNGEIFPAIHTIIHPRCANPRTGWTEDLRRLQNTGYKVVNSVDTIELTSNKLACSLHLQGKVNHPKSWEYIKEMRRDEYFGLFDIIANQLDPSGRGINIIAKPYTSLEQGANVKKLQLDSEDGTNYDWLASQINQIPGNKVVIQEYIPYTALHRVIVIGGKALPYTFIDRVEFHNSGDWKVSCCLNRTTMKLNENADGYLLKLAEDTQKEVGGVINFIDIFEYESRDGMSIEYTNAEINTACSLNIHERLAKEAGRNDWNIHYRIAKELVKGLGIR